MTFIDFCCSSGDGLCKKIEMLSRPDYPQIFWRHFIKRISSTFFWWCGDWTQACCVANESNNHLVLLGRKESMGETTLANIWHQIVKIYLFLIENGCFAIKYRSHSSGQKMITRHSNLVQWGRISCRWQHWSRMIACCFFECLKFLKIPQNKTTFIRDK